MKILTSIVLFVLCICAGQSYAYAPPIGIPEPGFGVDAVAPSRPNPWASEVPGYYYVNYQTGTDSGRPYGTPSAPRQTIPDPIPAGGYVEVVGTYSHAPGGSTFIQGAGTSDSPTWVVGIAGSEPVFDKNTYLYGTYLFIDNIKSNGSSFNIRGNDYTAHHIMVRNSDLDSEGRIAVGMSGTSTTSIHDIIFYKNTIHDTSVNWNDGSGVDTDYHGIAPSNYVYNVWIIDNTFYNISGNAVQIGGATSGLDNVNHIYFGRNTVYKTRQSSVGIKKSSDVVISSNILYDTRTAYNGTGTNYCAGVSYQYAPRRLWILNNIISDADHGIKGGSGTSPVGDYVYILGNLIYNINSDASGDVTSGWDEGSAIRIVSAVNAYVIGNTIHNVDIGIETPTTNQNLHIENNIVSSVLYDHTRIEYSATANLGSFKNNLFYQDGTVSLKIGATKYTVATYPHGSGNIFANPVFVNTATDNYSIQSSSPAKGAGVLSDVYATFYSLYGIDISKDIAGTTRPQDGAWDIGAYEYTPPGTRYRLRIQE